MVQFLCLTVQRQKSEGYVFRWLRLKNVASDVLHCELRPTFPDTSCGDLENCVNSGGLDSRVM